MQQAHRDTLNTDEERGSQLLIKRCNWTTIQTNLYQIGWSQVSDETQKVLGSTKSTNVAQRILKCAEEMEIRTL